MIVRGLRMWCSLACLLVVLFVGLSVVGFSLRPSVLFVFFAVQRFFFSFRTLADLACVRHTRNSIQVRESRCFVCTGEIDQSDLTRVYRTIISLRSTWGQLCSR